MAVLKSLTFTAVPARGYDPVSVRRAKLVSRLEEQRLLLGDASHVRTVQKWTGKGDDRRQTEKKQRVLPWWRADAGDSARFVILGLLRREAHRVREGQGRHRGRVQGQIAGTPRLAAHRREGR